MFISVRSLASIGFWYHKIRSGASAPKQIKKKEVKHSVKENKKDRLVKAYLSEKEYEHQLRHTYCSMLQWSGVDIKTAQELMGHSEYGVTANIYTHVDEQSKANAAMLQDKFIKETLVS